MEMASVILDLAISFATEISKFKTVLLLIDWKPSLHFDDNKIQNYFKYLQSTKAHFQSIFVSPNPKPGIKWTGWSIAKLINATPKTVIVQDRL